MKRVRYRWRWLTQQPVMQLSAVLALTLVLVAQFLGTLERSDVGVRSAGRVVSSLVQGGEVPLVITLDDRTVERLGPPPWGADAWAEIDATIARQGIDTALVVDPWKILGKAGAFRAAPHVVMPRVDTAGRPQSSVPSHRVLPLSVALGPPVAEVPLPRRRAGRWLPCAWSDGACLEGHTRLPVYGANLQVVSMADLLDEDEPLLVPPKSGVLIGLTAQPWLREHRFGAGAREIPQVLAVAQLVSAARASGPRAPVTPWLALVWLLTVYAVASAMWMRRERGMTSLLVVFVALASVQIVGAIWGVWFPATATLALAVIPPLVGWSSKADVAWLSLRRLALLVVRGASRSGGLRRRILNTDDLRDVISDLSGHHAPGMGWALILRDPRGAYTIAAAEGLDGEVRPETLEADPQVLDRVFRSSRGVGIDGVFLTAGVRGMGLPLFQSEERVGVWCLAYMDGQEPPEMRHLRRLARWVGGRLALPGLPGAIEPGRPLMPQSLQDDALDLLLLDADEERRRWMRCVEAVSQPIMVTDVAGELALVNRSMEEVFDELSPRVVRSLKDLVDVATEGRGEGTLRHLFREGRPVRVLWDRKGKPCYVVARPVAPRADRHGDRTYLGFLAWLEDVPIEVLRAREVSQFRAEADQAYGILRSHIDQLLARGRLGSVEAMALRGPMESLLGSAHRLAEVAEPVPQTPLQGIALSAVVKAAVGSISKTYHQRGLQVGWGRNQAPSEDVVVSRRERSRLSILLKEVGKDARLSDQVVLSCDVETSHVWIGVTYHPEPDQRGELTMLRALIDDVKVEEGGETRRVRIRIAREEG